MRCLHRQLVNFALALTLVVSHVQAKSHRVHTVYAGQRLGSIAKRYNVSVQALCHANRIEKCATIRPGQKLLVPERSDKDGTEARELVDGGYLQAEGHKANTAEKSSATRPQAPPEKKSKPSGRSTHTVAAGQRLGSIAKRYRVSVQALCGANGISANTAIHPGQELVIPSRDDDDGSEARRLATVDDKAVTVSARSAAPPAKSKPRQKSWKLYAKKPWRRGYVHVIGHHASWKGYLIGRENRVLPAARQAISRVLAWPRRDKLMAGELLALLGRVSDEFGGRPLRVVSGYRERSFARESKHRLGRAVDFRVVGVPNEALRDFLRSLGSVGVGYYPNSTFVHFDVRELPTYWVDDSGPGQPPRYRHIAAQPSAD